MTTVICPYCNRPAVFHPPVNGAAAGQWVCSPCDARVSCHKEGVHVPHRGISDGTMPMGTLANHARRAARLIAHKALDPIWKGGAVTRGQLYAELAKHMGLPLHRAHIAMFDEAQCEQVEVFARNYGISHNPDCPECAGTGRTSAWHRVRELIGMILQSAADVEANSCSPALQVLSETGGQIVSADILELTRGLARSSPSSRLGYDDVDAHRVLLAIMETAGIRPGWGLCHACDRVPQGDNSTAPFGSFAQAFTIPKPRA